MTVSIVYVGDCFFVLSLVKTMLYFFYCSNPEISLTTRQEINPESPQLLFQNHVCWSGGMLADTTLRRSVNGFKGIAISSKLQARQ